MLSIALITILKSHWYLPKPALVIKYGIHGFVNHHIPAPSELVAHRIGDEYHSHIVANTRVILSLYPAIMELEVNYGELQRINLWRSDRRVL